MEHPGEKHTGELSRILSEWDNPQQAVLPMFHYFMERDKYISPEALEHIGRLTGISQSDLLGIGTFYQYFSFHKEGRHTVRVCLATPCVFCGGKGLLETLQKELGVALDETTEDGIFTRRRCRLRRRDRHGCQNSTPNSGCFARDSHWLSPPARTSGEWHGSGGTLP